MDCVLNELGHDNTLVSNDLNYVIEYNHACLEVITGQMRQAPIWWHDQQSTKKTYRMYAIPNPGDAPWFSYISVGY
jgi:hypothetical protein